MQRENYYILLDLDPTVQDQPTIEAAILAKQREWSTLRTHPSRGTWANQNLGSLPAIRKLMGDVINRKAEAEEAKKKLLSREKEKNEKLNRALKTLMSKGYVTEWEIQALIKRKEFKAFTVEGVKKLITVKITKGGNQSKPEQIKPLPSSQAKEIDRSLKLVTKTDLYDFLGLQPSSSLKILQKSTIDKDIANKRIAKKDAIYTATQSLVGLCQSIFKTEDTRKSYDKTISLRRFKSIEEQLNIAGNDKIIQVGEYKHILNLGGKLGLKQAETKAFIQDYCRKKGWALSVPDQLEAQQLECGICRTLNPPKSKNCSHCSTPLEITCPSCKTVNRSTSHSCTNCGFAIGDLPNALTLIRSAKVAISMNKFDKAIQLFNQAAFFWKDHPDIIKGKQQIAAEQKKVHADTERIKRLVADKKLMEAQVELSKLKIQGTSNPTVLSLTATIQASISKADAYVQKAEKAKLTYEKEQYFLEAIQICQDHLAAKNGVRKILPEAPKQLKLTVKPEGVLVEWTAVKSKFPIKYVIVRKENLRPIHAKDGLPLTETNLTAYNDFAVEAGKSFYYAVFTKRETILSKNGVVSDLVTKLGEIKNLKVTPGEKQINLNWTPPPNTVGFEVWIKEGRQPTRNGDGSLVSGIGKNGCTLRNLKNDVAYGFLIRSVFKDKFGKTLETRGIGGIAKPTAPPQPINILELEQNGSSIDLTWFSSREEVDVLVSTRPFTYKFGEFVAVNQIKKEGIALPIYQKGRASYKIPHHGVFHFVAITIKNNLAVVGESQKAIHFQEVLNFQGKVNEQTLQLNWEFPNGVEKILLSFRDSANYSDFQQIEVTKNKRGTGGEFSKEILAEQWAEVIISIQTIIDTSVERFISKGLEKIFLLKKVEARLAVQKKKTSMGFFFKQKSYAFNAKIKLSGTTSIPIQLVVKENNKLISYKDTNRTVIQEIEGYLFSNGVYEKDFTYTPTNKEVRKLFFSLIPKFAKDRDELSIKGNGIQINL